MDKNKRFVSYIGEPLSGTAMYVTKKVENLINNLEGVENCMVFCESTIDVPEKLSNKHQFVMTDKPQLEYIRYVTKIAQEIEAKDRKRKLTLTEQGYYIGENVTLGENCTIEPMCLIGHDVVIGNDAYIRAGAVIKNAIIGNNFLANESCAIGMNGYTFSKDEDGNQVRIPSLGKVVIGNNVEVGALTNVSVGSAGDTIIRDNVKIDCLVHVAHDVYLDENVELTAGVIIGGFVRIGKSTFVGVNSSLRNRISVGDDSLIGMGSVVVKSMGDNANVLGNPAKPFERKV